MSNREILILEELGLTQSEVKTYIALLELGTCTAGTLANKANVASSKIYEILDKLENKGLASHIIDNGIKAFTATSPEFLLDYVSEKEDRLAEEKQKVQKMLPTLRKLSALAAQKSESNIYRGMKGLKAAFYEPLEQLKRGDEMLVLNTPSRSDLVNRFFSHFVNDLKTKGIKIRCIFSEEAKKEIEVIPSFAHIKRKYIKNLTPAAINIIGKRVIIFPKEVTSPTLFVIDNADVAESFRIQFESTWRSIN